MWQITVSMSQSLHGEYTHSNKCPANSQTPVQYAIKHEGLHQYSVCSWLCYVLCACVCVWHWRRREKEAEWGLTSHLISHILLCMVNHSHNRLLWLCVFCDYVNIYTFMYMIIYILHFNTECICSSGPGFMQKLMMTQVMNKILDFTIWSWIQTNLIVCFVFVF